MKEPDFYSERFKEASELTHKITDYLNNFSYSENALYFCEAMSREHRTLQQNFMRLIMGYLEYVKSDAYRTDGRNEASKKLATAILDALDYNEDYHGFSPSECLPTI